MSFHRRPVPLRFTPEKPVEMHFHDQDETWIVMGGKAVAHMVDRDGARTDFEIEEGDVWMVEAGVEHGCDPAAGGVHIFPFLGTRAEGSHEPGHYYFGKEKYMPTLVLRRDPLSPRGGGNVVVRRVERP